MSCLDWRVSWMECDGEVEGFRPSLNIFRWSSRPLAESSGNDQAAETETSPPLEGESVKVRWLLVRERNCKWHH